MGSCSLRSFFQWIHGITIEFSNPDNLMNPPGAYLSIQVYEALMDWCLAS